MASAEHAVAAGSLYATDSTGRLHAVASDGTERWVYSLADSISREDGGLAPDVQVTDIAASDAGTIALLASAPTGRTAGTTYLALVDSDGTERWHRPVEPPSGTPHPLAVGTDVYVAGQDGTLRAYEAADGHDLWKFAVSGAALGSPRIGADGTIYVRGGQGRVHALSPDGRERWTYDPE